jgi:lysyl endopeptidase
MVEGQRLWTAAIRSPGALGLRVHFTDFDVGSGTLIVYAGDGDKMIVRGPFTDKGPDQDGDFWSASLPGDTVFVEVTGTEEPSLNILEIVHFDKMFSQPSSSSLELEEPPSLSCELDVMCYNDPPIDTCARQASVQINFQKDGGFYLCSGTILTDLDGETTVPHFLTAYHCLHTQAAVDTLEVVFFWQTGSCGGTLPSYFTLPRLNGGTLLETNDTDDGNDMSFIRLSGSLPGGACLAGWTTADLDSGYGIHHPGGDFKRLTLLSDVGFCPGCTFCGDPSDYDYFDIDGGITEKGSSGSGIFNYNGQLCGQLRGDCCLYASCAGESMNCSNKDDYVTTYGEFDTTYPFIRRWLEIGGTINVNAAYSGFTQEGSPSQPFKTVSAANDLAWDGVRVKINAGSYPESDRFTTAQVLLAEGGTVIIGR